MGSPPSLWFPRFSGILFVFCIASFVPVILTQSRFESPGINDDSANQIKSDPIGEQQKVSRPYQPFDWSSRYKDASTPRNRTLSSRRREEYRRRYKLARQNTTMPMVIDQFNTSSSVSSTVLTSSSGSPQSGRLEVLQQANYPRSTFQQPTGQGQSTYSFNRTISYSNRTWGSNQKPAHWVDRYWHWSSGSNATRSYDADLDGTTLPPDDDGVWIPPPGNYFIPEDDVPHPWSFYGSTSCDRNSCTPPTGDLLIGRAANLSASSTCGLFSPEKYCILGDTSKRKKCYTCDSRDSARRNPLRYHRIESIVTKAGEDYRTYWWQAENGVQNVSIQLDLGAEFHLTHIIMTFQTFRPAAMLIERSSDSGRTWKVYQYFAADCAREYPWAREGPRRDLREVVCESQYSAVTPSYHGEVIFKVLPPNIPIRDPYAADVQDLLKMTNLRINFTKLHTLGDNLLDPRPEIRQKYYYAMMNMKVRGSCSCYGHASRCVPEEGQPPIAGMVYGKCECEHHTKGPNCHECDDFYQDAEWKPAVGRETNECKRCNCNNHANKCHFDRSVWAVSGNKSGGVCDNCAHNTKGIHCEECVPYFYRDPARRLDDPYVCQPCNCDRRGSLDDGICESKTDELARTVAGNCHCKENVEGQKCDRCKVGFWNFDENNPLGCQACSCNTLGTLHNQGCNPVTGECVCKNNVVGRDCNACQKYHYGLELFEDGCRPCNCDAGGSLDLQCDQTNGQCLCRPHMTGQKCETVEPGFYIPSVDAIIYEAEKAHHSADVIAWIMQPYPGAPPTWTGDGFVRVYEKSWIDFEIDPPFSSRYDIIVRYQPPEPNWSQGTILIEPLAGGVTPSPGSPCEKDFEYRPITRPFAFEAGRTYTKAGPYCFERGQRYRIRIDVGTRTGGYDNSTIAVDSVVLIPLMSDVEIFANDKSNREMEEYRRYRCDEYLFSIMRHQIPEVCKKIYQSISVSMYNGGMPCTCDPTGSESAICESYGGTCRCKPNVIGRTCDRCAQGHYGFGPEGCKPCDCHSIGSLDNFCDPVSGKCKCRDNTYGRRCDECQPGFWNYPNCQRCDCNGHAETCDSRTGECRECQDNTKGPNCGNCTDGYYGNPLIGYNIPCRPCPCPNVPESGNFHADGCRLDPITNLPRCFCKIGYNGERCDQCDENYFGEPSLPGGTCQPCECNRNTDISQPGNCDRRTGVCLRCLYYTEGDHCERCRSGFYGNALMQQCTECVCSPLGTDPSIGTCDHLTGQCPCLPHVIGRECDKCEVNHWNITSGVGCAACDCDPQGSFNLRCSEIDGQCPCRPGHGGRKCNECQPNHYGDPRIQCYPCDCDPTGSASMQCNKHDGSCVCLKGIAGIKCNQCARGYLGTAPRCESCGECFENWDGTIQQLKDETLRLIERARKIKQTGAPGAYGKSFITIENKLLDAEILISGSNVTDTDIEGVQKAIDELRREVDRLNQKIAAAERDTESTVQRTARANLRLEELQLLANEVERHNNELRENATRLKADDFRGAFNLTEEAYRRSLRAEKRVAAALPNIYKSQKERYATEKLISSTNFDHEKSVENNRGSLNAISKKIKDLEDHIPDINKMVCGGRSTVDKCDYTCGGAGCSKCGDISCDAATTKAQSALKYGQEAETKLKDLKERGDEEMRNVEEARRRSDDALREAQRAYDRAILAKNNSESMSREIQELFTLIDEFMAAQSATPAEIRTVAENCLKIQISLTPEQILDLANQINATLKNVKNIEKILDETEADLRKAESLENEANYTKSKADEVLGMARELLDALKVAQEAQAQAASSIANANDQINGAQSDLDSISGETEYISKQSLEAQAKIEELKAKLDGLKVRYTKNKYAVAQASEEAAHAGDGAKQAERAAQELDDKFNEARKKLAQKESESGLQKQKSESIRARSEKLSKEAGEKLRLLQDIEDNFTENEELLNGYQTEIDKMSKEVLGYLEIIETRSAFHKNCQT